MGKRNEKDGFDGPWRAVRKDAADIEWDRKPHRRKPWLFGEENFRCTSPSTETHRKESPPLGWNLPFEFFLTVGIAVGAWAASSSVCRVHWVGVLTMWQTEQGVDTSRPVFA